MARSARSGALATLGLILLTLAGTVSFLYGFLPLKPFLGGFSRAPGAGTTPPPFDRLAFVLVDALRSIIESGHALPFTALASPPTVTLPRLKALTTGANPTFLDAILNIADDDSAAVLENVDSWVRQLAVGDGAEDGNRRHVSFVGDDTWLRLFPRRWFHWTQGISSFYVADTTTVDTNVSRHLNALLADPPVKPSLSPFPSEFDATILHFLGMDHVGHLGGSKSALMGPKQREMDGAIEQLFTRLGERDEKEGRKSLIVLVGDHGMTDAGNHGGSTDAETSAALLFASPSTPPVAYSPPPPHDSPYRFHQVVNQIDLTPTLSVLMGLGIPTNSMGKLIEPVIQRWVTQPLGKLLQRNAQQLERVVEAASPGAGAELSCRASSREGGECVSVAGELGSATELSLFLSLAQERLRTTFGDYHIAPMLAGLGVLSLACAGLVKLNAPFLSAEDPSVKALILTAVAVYLATLFATSFIEEEHEFWFFATATGLLLLATSLDLGLLERIPLVTAAVSVRLMRAWSANGQKDQPNRSLSHLLTTSPRASAHLSFVTYALAAALPFYLFFRAAQPSNRPAGSTVAGMFLRALSFALLLTALLLQLVVVMALRDGGEQVRLRVSGLVAGRTELARAVYGLGAGVWGLARVARLGERGEAGHLRVVQLMGLGLVLVSLSRGLNVGLFGLLWVQYGALWMVRGKVSVLAMAGLVVGFQQVSFFAFGGSNSLATIDLSSAYNGLAAYDAPLVGLLTLLANFAGPVFWAAAAPALLPAHAHADNAAGAASPWRRYVALTTAFHSVVLAVLAASAAHFRRHLFTWTVFSPALVYKGVWWALVQVGLGIGVGSLQ